MPRKKSRKPRSSSVALSTQRRIAAYRAAAEGDFSELDRLNLQRLGELGLLHDEAVRSCRDQLLVEEKVIDPTDGKTVIASKVKLNPLADFAIKTAPLIGVDADQMRATPRAKAVQGRDEAVRSYLERDRQASESLKLRAVEVEVIEEKE